MKVNRIIVTCSILIMLILFSCSPKVEDPTALPYKATEVTPLGNGWITFRLDDRLFLFHRLKHGAQGYESMTELTRN